MSGQMDVDMSLDEIAERDGAKNQRRRRGKNGGGRRNPPATEQQRQRGGRRLLDKPEYVPVVFGNGTPEKVLTGRLNDSLAGKREPVNLVKAALARGTEVFLKNQARQRGKTTPSKTRRSDQGARRPSLGASPRRRPVIQHPLSRKLHIVRPSDPGYKRQLRQLRDSTYAVRVVREQRNTRSPKAAAPSAPSDRLMPQQARRSVLGMAQSSPSSANGPLSSRFSNLSHK